MVRFENFYDAHYPQDDVEPIDCTNMQNILDYLATDILTAYETNIKQHYFKYVDRFVNVLFHRNIRLPNLSEADAREFLAMLRQVKNDAL